MNSETQELKTNNNELKSEIQELKNEMQQQRELIERKLNEQQKYVILSFEQLKSEIQELKTENNELKETVTKLVKMIEEKEKDEADCFWKKYFQNKDSVSWMNSLKRNNFF